MMDIRTSLKASDLAPRLDRMWALSAAKIKSIEKSWDPAAGSSPSPPTAGLVI